MKRNIGGRREFLWRRGNIGRRREDVGSLGGSFGFTKSDERNLKRLEV